MIWDFLQAFTNVRDKQKLFADDSVAKLNRITTVSLLVIVALFMTAKNYSGDQIQCNGDLSRLSFTQSYVNSICWVKEIYEAEFYDSQHPTEGFRFNFYPWLPIITLFLALCFYSPYIIWKMFLKNNMYEHMPIDVNSLVMLLSDANNLNKKTFNENIEKASSYLDRCFSLNNYADSVEDSFDDVESMKKLLKEPKGFRYRIKAKKVFMPLALFYLFVKFIYFFISISIFGIIDFIFRFEKSFYFYGYNMLRSMYFHSIENDKLSYLRSSYFPRVVICELHSREDAVNPYVQVPFQCVLPANFLNEKIFIGLWVWFCILVVFNFLSIIKWIFKLINRKRIVKEMVSWPFDYGYDVQNFIDPFVNNYLRTEGFLVLMLIKCNTRDWSGRMILNCLFKNYIKKNIENSNYANKQVEQSPSHSFVNDFPMKKSPISTIKCENRRKLDMDMEESNPIKGNK